MIREINNAHQAWEVAHKYAEQTKKCTSVKGIVYNLNIGNESNYFTTATRNGGKPEEISKHLFVEFFNALKGLVEINTNTIKEIMPSGLYKKRSLIIALLKSSEVIK